MTAPNAALGSRRSTRPRRAARLGWISLVAFACGASLSGCKARRVLDIRSNPPGALVRIDEDVLGRTPLEVDFLHYGTRRLNLYLDGYRTHSERLKLRPRWYTIFPIDLITEILIPIGWTDRRKVRVQMIPTVGGDLVDDIDSVLERAEAFRSATPGGPRPREIKPPTEPEVVGKEPEPELDPLEDAAAREPADSDGS